MDTSLGPLFSKVKSANRYAGRMSLSKWREENSTRKAYIRLKVMACLRRDLIDYGWIETEKKKQKVKFSSLLINSAFIYLSFSVS